MLSARCEGVIGGLVVMALAAAPVFGCGDSAKTAAATSGQETVVAQAVLYEEPIYEDHMPYHEHMWYDEQMAWEEQRAYEEQMALEEQRAREEQAAYEAQWAYEQELAERAIRVHEAVAALPLAERPGRARSLAAMPVIQPAGSEPVVNDFTTTTVYLGAQPVLRFRSSAGGFTAEERVAICLTRLKDALADRKFGHTTVGIGTVLGEQALFCNGLLLLTVTQADAEANATTPRALAEEWAGNLRRAIREIAH